MKIVLSGTNHRNTKRNGLYEYIIDCCFEFLIYAICVSISFYLSLYLSLSILSTQFCENVCASKAVVVGIQHATVDTIGQTSEMFEGFYFRLPLSTHFRFISPIVYKSLALKAIIHQKRNKKFSNKKTDPSNRVLQKLHKLTRCK